MTYKDIDMSHNKLSPNAQLVKVELDGHITNHWVHGQTYGTAVKNLMKTGWFANSRRSIYFK